MNIVAHTDSYVRNCFQSIGHEHLRDFTSIFLMQDNWWIGLSDIATEGTFVWEGGQNVDEDVYTDWFTGEPNDAAAGHNHVADCVWANHCFACIHACCCCCYCCCS